MTDQSTPLGGEADPNSWHFQRADQEGPLPNPVGHTFPILTHNSLGVWELVGTGFYISSDGLFVTARHVVKHVLDDGRQIAPLVIVHQHSDTGLFGPSQVLFRPIMQCWLGNPADVALGVAATATNNQTGEHLRHWCWPLSWSIPADGEHVGTYAFPQHSMSPDGRSLHLHPDLYPGEVRSTGPFRDRSMVPFPYLEVNCRIHGAASGGPIAQAGGGVVGVNCTELSKTLDHPPGPGFGAQIRCLQDAFIDDASLSGENSRRVTFDELVHAGRIVVANYVASSRPATGSPPVRLDQVLVTAAHPQISTVLYA
jgi:Trypsin-like peptidase domain